MWFFKLFQKILLQMFSLLSFSLYEKTEKAEFSLSSSLFCFWELLYHQTFRKITSMVDDLPLPLPACHSRRNHLCTSVTKHRLSSVFSFIYLFIYSSVVFYFFLFQYMYVCIIYTTTTTTSTNRDSSCRSRWYHLIFLIIIDTQ